MSDTTENLVPEIMRDVRELYEALQKFDLLAAKALDVNLTDLRAINILGDGPLTPKAIGERLGLTSGAVTTLIDRLEKAEAAVREHAADRRSVLVILKPAFRERTATVYQKLGDSIIAEICEAGLANDPAAQRMPKAILSGVEATLIALTE